MKIRFLFYILFILNYSLMAQNYRVSGRVLSEDGTPVSSAYVLIKEIPIAAYSDSLGNYFFDNLLPGNYLITASRIGYKRSYQKISLSESENRIVDFILSSSPIELGEISVISTKTDNQLRDVAIPLEYISSEFIEKSPAGNVPEILKSKPGISLIRDGIWAVDVNIRGLSRGNIVTLIDGNRIETSDNIGAGLSMIHPGEISSIEVIKGAASSLYGSGATGGVVNIITQRGNFKNSFGINGSLYSDYYSVNNGTSSGISLNIGENFWFANFRGTLRNAGDTETPAGTLNNSRFRDKSIAGTLGFLVTDNHQITLDYQQFYAEDVGLPGSALFPSSAVVRYPVEERRLFSGEYTYRNISQIFSRLSVKFFNQFIKREVENIPNIINEIPSNGASPPRRVNVLSINPGADHLTNGIYLKTDWVIFKSHFTILGIDAWQRNYEGFRTRDIRIDVLNPADNSIVNSIYQQIGELPLPNSSYRSIGLFIQDEFYAIENKLKLTIGGRVDQIRVENEVAFQPIYVTTNGMKDDSPPNQIRTWEKTSDSDIVWSSNIGLLYSLTKTFDFTLNFARSFRAPSLEERYQFIDLGSVIRVGDPSLNPEHGYLIDAGVKIWHPRVTFTGNIFLNFLTDLLVDKPGIYLERNAMISSNVGKARLYGFDFSFEYNFFKSSILYGNASFVRGEDTEAKKDLPQIPPFNGLMGIKTPIANVGEINLSGNFFSAQNRVSDGEFTTPGYFYFDVYLNSAPIELADINLILFFGIENLGDKSFRNHLSTNRGLVTIEPGRNIFLRVKLNF